MSEEKTFPTLYVASTVTGIGLVKGFSFDKYHEIAQWICGHPVWTHELGHGPTRELIISEGYDQFPLFPNPEEARNDWQAAAKKATDAYGENVSVKKGAHERHASPQETLKVVAPHLNVIVVDKGKPNG